MVLQTWRFLNRVHRVGRKFSGHALPKIECGYAIVEERKRSENMKDVTQKTSKQDAIIAFIKTVQTNWTRADISSKAAEMAYFTLLSLFPIILVFVNILPLLPIPQKEVLGYLAVGLPANVYTVIQPIITNYLNSASGGIISIGLITSIWSASEINLVLRTVLDQIYGIDSGDNYLVTRILSFGLMLVLGAALLGIMFIVAFGRQILSFVEKILQIDLPTIQRILGFRWLFLLIILFVFFLIIYHVFPKHHLQIKYSLPGAVFSTVGWIILSQAFTLYTKFAGGDAVTNTTFGGFVILMLFLYVSGMITFLGALLNTLYFELSTKQTVAEYNEKLKKEKELEQEGTTEYPKAETVLLKRKLVKVKRLNEEEIEEWTRKKQEEGN